MKAELLNYLQEALSQEEILPFKSELRASNVPFCPIYQMYMLQQGYVLKYESEFYMEIGTAIHKVLQKWVPRYKNKNYRVIGNWECFTCKEEFKFCTKPKCASKNCQIFYKEVGLEYGTFTGNVDLILKGDKNVVIDFKSTSDYKIDLQNFEANPKYLHQIDRYAFILEQTGFVPDYTTIVYVGRDKSIDYKTKKFRIKVIEEKWTKEKSKKVEKLITLEMERNTLLENYLKSKDKKDLKKVIENRPCKTLNNYYNYMKAQFVFGQCPLLDTCTSKFPEKILMKNFKLERDG
jgi:hypothetical protein